MQKDITIYDIASELNVSPATVSRALSNHFSIGAKTKKAVQELAQMRGYKPNTVASNLRRKKTNSIGVIIPFINRPFISSAISGIEEVANAAGYTVVISQSNDSFAKEVANSQTLFSNRVDGLIVSLAMDSLDYTHIKVFQARGIPLVLFDRVTEEVNVTKVIIDNYAAAYAATEHLIKNGYTRIAHLAGPQTRNIYRERLRGYQGALQKHKLPLKQEYILPGDLTPEAGEAAIEQLLALGHPPGALFCANDNAAVSAIQKIKQMGLQIPQDLAVVGFNNDPVSLIIEPALTTVHHPAFEMGKAAAQQLLHQLDYTTTLPEPQTILLPTQLLIRASSGGR